MYISVSFPMAEASWLQRIVDNSDRSRIPSYLLQLTFIRSMFLNFRLCLNYETL